MQRIVLDEFAPGAVVVDDGGGIVSASGNLEKYLTPDAGPLHNNLTHLVRGDLRVPLRAALRDAAEGKRKIVTPEVGLVTEAGVQGVILTVQPMPQPGDGRALFLVVFGDVGRVAGPAPRQDVPPGDASAAALIERLERDLAAARRDMEALVQGLKNANEELETSKELRLHGIIDSMFAFVGLLDRDGTLREANRAPLEAANLSRAEVIGRPFWECAWWTHDPAVQGRLRAAFARAVEGEVVRYDETIRVRDDGRIVIDFMLQPVAVDGEVQFVIPSAVDITARVTAEAETRRLARDLASRVEETETLLRVMPVGIGIAHDPVARRITMNPVFASLFGIAQDANASLTAPEGEWPTGFRAFAGGREIPPGMLSLQVAAREGITVKGLQLDIVHDDGRVMHVLQYAAPLFAEDGSPRGSVGAFVDVTEHKRAELELRYQHDLARSMMDNATTPIFMMDAHGCCTFANPAAEAMTGFSRNELVGKILHDVIHHTRRDGSPYPASACPIHQVIHQRIGIHDHEEMFIHRDGHFYPVVCNARMIRREGVEIGTVLEARDVTEERAAEARFKTLAESIPQLAWMARPDGEIIWYNRRWYDYTGTTLEQMRGWGWQQIHDPEVLRTVLQRWHRSLATGDPFDMVFPLRGADGIFRPFLTRVEPVRDELGQIQRWFGTNTDISEQRAVTSALERRERELRSLADNSPNILTRFDRAHRYVFVNLAVERTTGWQREQFLGKTNRELGMPPELCDLWDVALGRVFETAEPTALEFTHDSPIGVRHYTARLVPEFDAAGEVETVLGVTHDQTEVKLANEALRDADHRKDEFLAMLAHELRNPLAPLRSGLELVRSGAADTERIYAMMSRQLSQLVRLVDDLLDVSRISRGKLELNLERIDIRTAVEAAIETARPAIDANRHALTVHWFHEALWVQADATRLAQMVSNLLNNAAKYTPPGGAITLVVGRNAGRALVQVTDNGFGISAEQLPHMFSMFTQIARTKARAQGGLGIGLALVHRLAELHGGTITAQSEGIDQGSTFTLEMPISTAEESPVSKKPLRADPEIDPGRRVLIVDDNHDAAEMLTELLEYRGFAVQFVTTGEAGLDAAPRFQPHIVLLDIGLPDISGYDVARKLRKSFSSRELKIVALSGWGTTQDKERSREAGFDDHLVKPVSLDALFKALS
jgi:PAS domain S-box-containing protein